MKKNPCNHPRLDLKPKHGQPAAHAVAAMLFAARLGATLKMLRKARGMTVSDLAKASGVAAATIRNAESAECDPTASTLYAIEVATEVERGFLIRASAG